MWLVLLSFAAVGALLLNSWWRAPERWLVEGKTALMSGRCSAALELAQRVLQRRPDSLDALLLAAEASLESDQLDVALKYCARLPDNADEPRIVETLRSTAQSAVFAGRATAAEGVYSRALKLAPDDLLMHRRLSAIYLAESRRWESQPHLFALVRGKEFTLEELAFLGNGEELFEAEAMLEFFLKSDPNDVLPLMGRARLLIFKGFTDEGEAMLRQILAQRPDLIEAQVQLGIVLVSESRHTEFRNWHAQLPAAADSHPEIWWVRATQARREGNAKAAVRCAWEALRLDPGHLGACYQLAQLLASLDQPEAAQVFAERASRLELLATTVHDVLLRGNTAERVMRCARLTEDLGRLWEAWGWHMVLQTYHPTRADARQLSRLAAQLTPELPQTLPDHQLARVFDFSGYPLPRWSVELTDAAGGAGQPPSKAKFEDVSAAIGLDWRYQNGAPPDRPGLMIYQSIGGGVGAVDVDRDGWPDLLFPQASAAAPLEAQPIESSDRLFRNARGLAVDVTDAALPGDLAFGFGVATGDFDCDGFADVYLANAGRNILLRNLGDGTLQDVTEAAGLTSHDWTASALVADLNGDGLPDLYDVNYCGGDRPFTHVCHREDNDIPRTCIPTEFPAADDRLFINLGNGEFRDVTATAGILHPEGRGLGILAGRLDDQPGLDLYIANDMSANFLFLNRTEPSAKDVRFIERGVVSGTAYDADGRPQASMGIAADDADGDGRLDLFLTHFYNESNTFYRQHSGSFFTDESNFVGLREPSMQTLGFGTQFLDAELDGWPDLVVANGHVDDFTEGGMPFRMRPQYFSNNSGKFTEVTSERLGDFFVREQVGRGLARLDWNHDHRDDFVVSRLFDNTAVVLNRTAETGHAILLQFTGRTDRDAIGTEVRVTAGDRTLVRQLVSGDGFACANERRLTVGIGAATQADRLEIRWPDGSIAEFQDVSADRLCHIIEDTARVFVVPD